MSTTGSPRQVITSWRPPVTSPITVAGTSQRAQILRKASRSAGVVTAIIRSWDSLIKISGGVSPWSRSGTVSRSTAMPTPPAAASSVVAQAIPAAPRSPIATTTPAAYNSRQHSISSFSMNGSPTCTFGRFARSPSAAPNEALASTDAPPMPSGPVGEPNRITLLPGPLAAASLRSLCRITPRQSALTSGFPA